MALLFMSREDDPAAWRAALTALDPTLDFRVWPEAGELAEIDAALVWQPPPGMLKDYPNLRLVQSLGAGIDHIFSDPELPDVPVARLIDPELTRQMIEYVLLALLSRHRRMDRFRAQQQERAWVHAIPLPATATRVGVLGIGAIGGAVARAIAGLGFPVTGWSRRPRQVEGIEAVSGDEALEGLLAQSDVLVCLLPLTPDTEGILDARAFAALPKDAYVINAGRGGHLVEADLLAALDSGHLSGAWLDVFRAEPLPTDHRFWHHPKVTMTPHVAAWVLPNSGAAFVLDNLRRVRAGEEPLHRVDLGRGY